MSDGPVGSFDPEKPFEVLPDGQERTGESALSRPTSSWRNSLSFLVPLVILCVITGVFSYSSGYDRGSKDGRKKVQIEHTDERAGRTEVARLIWQMAREDLAAQRTALAEAERKEAESKAEYERVSTQLGP